MGCESIKIGIYAPYLEVCGGGEKYICKIAERLNEKNEVYFIMLKNINTKELEKRLNINMCNVKIIALKGPHLFFIKLPIIRMLSRIHALSQESINYDLFINQEHFSCIPSHAKKSILICEEPPVNSKNIFKMAYTYFIHLLYDPKLKTYDKIVTNSNYTKKWAQKWYQKNIYVLYPPAEQFTPCPKKNMILSVGRFFKKGHSKKQLELIRIFKQIYEENENLKNWEYHLVGGVSFDSQNRKYLAKCKDEAQGYPIYFHINASFEDLKQLYGTSRIFWHAAGLNENEKRHPDRMEHFGITTVEAMSAGCVPVVINKGGQAEIVSNMIDGFSWNTIEELKKYTLTLINDNITLEKFSQAAIDKSKEFQIDRFNYNVDLILEV